MGRHSRAASRSSVETTGDSISVSEPHHDRPPEWLSAASPRVWLYTSVAGLALFAVGVAFAMVRSWDDALAIGLGAAGLALAAVGALMALTLAAFATAPSNSNILGRAAGVLVAWIAFAGVAAGLVTDVATSGLR